MKKKLKSILKSILKNLTFVTKKDFLESIDEVNSRINFVTNDAYRVERDLSKMIENYTYRVRVELNIFKLFKNIEYKMYELNKYNNRILYENQLSLNELSNKIDLSFNPKVSIIIPVYNGSNFLRFAIDSAIKQTYKNIEIIVVNDGSNDNGETEKIAKSYGDKIKYYSKKNGGVSSALNYGIKNMTGDYFAWLSHDDLYCPNNIEEHIRFLQHNQEKDIITFTNFNIIDEYSNIILDETVMVNLYCFDYKMSIAKPEYSLLQGEINGGSVLIPKNAFNMCGLFDETLKISQERDMWFRLMKFFKFINIPIETTSIRNHSGQVTNTNSNVISETNAKILEIFKNLDNSTMENLEGTKYNFYTIMKNFYMMNSRYELANAMEEYLQKHKLDLTNGGEK